jgi:hypothetical protein
LALCKGRNNRSVSSGKHEFLLNAGAGSEIPRRLTSRIFDGEGFGSPSATFRSLSQVVTQERESFNRR